MKGDLNKELADLESKKQTALAKAEHDYSNHSCIHYRDNERFAWRLIR